MENINFDGKKLALDVAFKYAKNGFLKSGCVTLRSQRVLKKLQKQEY